MSHERNDRVAIPIQGWAAFRAERRGGGAPVEAWLDLARERGDRVAVPVQGWVAFLAGRHWGGDSGPIEQWFESGEELEHELTIEEADLWEQARGRGEKSA